jgi:hypothetical protein
VQSKPIDYQHSLGSRLRLSADKGRLELTDNELLDILFYGFLN